jgi:hypothetical protein
MRRSSMIAITIVITAGWWIFFSVDGRERFGAWYRDVISRQDNERDKKIIERVLRSPKPLEDHTKKYVENPNAPLVWIAKFYCKTPSIGSCTEIESTPEFEQEFSSEGECIRYAETIGQSAYNTDHWVLEYSCRIERSKIEPFAPNRRY